MKGLRYFHSMRLILKSHCLKLIKSILDTVVSDPVHCTADLHILE